jgi:hypothetical protein
MGAYWERRKTEPRLNQEDGRWCGMEEERWPGRGAVWKDFVQRDLVRVRIVAADQDGAVWTSGKK